jgi:hypothetical protein
MSTSPRSLRGPNWKMREKRRSTPLKICVCVPEREAWNLRLPASRRSWPALDGQKVNRYAGCPHNPPSMAA